MPENKQPYNAGSNHENEPELNTLQKIAEGTAAAIGTDFFRALVKSLADVTGMYGVWITELLEEKQRLNALAFWLNKKYVDHYEYDIAGTPCESALACPTIFHVPERVVELFPLDPDLPPMNAVSYMGVRLKDINEKVLGHLAILDNKPMYKRPRIATILKIFAARAAAELQRLRAEKDISESEQRLNRLVNGTYDAIIELDEKLKITQANKSANELFKLPNGQHALSLKQLVTLEGLKKITNALYFIKESATGLPYYWIQGYIDCLSTDGQRFPAEATLAEYNVHGSTYYILILRNANYRVAAEEKIKSLSLETELLREEIKGIYNLEEIRGQSEGMLKAMKEVQKVAVTDTTVLLLGETGTGKELFARAIHTGSKRKDKPLVKLNCAALPAGLIESELFGHEKGAFTGATAKREGRFALADKGTIFLDEIGELPLDLQAKLLRVLQEGEFEPVGSNLTKKADVRVIAATNRNLMDEVKAGRFREDLYYRLNIFPVNIPPLRERSNDIIHLAEFFLQKFSKQMHKKILPLPLPERQKLLSYRWPGNVRELQNVMERSVIISENGMVSFNFEKQHPLVSQPKENPAKILTIEELRAFEKENILRALKAANGIISGANGAAALLGVPSSTLNSRIKALGIERLFSAQ